MTWYHYIACFFAGLFLANFVPHYAKGIMAATASPLPFANPPGRGLSSPLVNVVWALFKPCRRLHSLLHAVSNLEQRPPCLACLLRRHCRHQHQHEHALRA